MSGGELELLKVVFAISSPMGCYTPIPYMVKDVINYCSGLAAVYLEFQSVLCVLDYYEENFNIGIGMHDVDAR